MENINLKRGNKVEERAFSAQESSLSHDYVGTFTRSDWGEVLGALAPNYSVYSGDSTKSEEPTGDSERGPGQPSKRPEDSGYIEPRNKIGQSQWPRLPLADAIRSRGRAWEPADRRELTAEENTVGTGVDSLK